MQLEEGEEDEVEGHGSASLSQGLAEQQGLTKSDSTPLPPAAAMRNVRRRHQEGLPGADDVLLYSACKTVLGVAACQINTRGT